MIKYLMAIIVVSMFILNAPAQDSTTASETKAAEDAAAVDPEQVDVEDVEYVDDADLDEQTYEEDEDDFVPTEEIPADTPIPFPTNI